ncbi:hypothetical protein F5I97DRAFT_2027864 [Phlebopus sp. FC_14]|nr:hypothetical protein F5I97DRAFT_2027864 [Phlebopus sp. FC_14]
MQVPADNVKKRRVSTRIANSKKRKPNGSGNQGAEARPAEDQPKLKKQRWGPVTGRLAGLMEMPMDILFEIFGHLNPLDVLRLTRTTKQFRSVLMHPSSRSVWIAARSNVPDLPGCPSYMSEPQFANLVFDTHCHECLAPNIRSVDWRIGRRICSKCAKTCMIEEYPVYDGGSVYGAVPSKYGRRGRASYYEKDILEFQQKRASFTDPQEREAFVKERQALVLEMEKHATRLEAWASNQARDRSEQLEDLRRERKQAIVEKLTELGWGPEIEQIPHRDDLSNHRLVKQPNRLTPRIWANIQGEMVRYMEQMRTQRLERERRALVISRKRIAVSILREYKIAHLPLTNIMPEPMDFCSIPEISEILESPTETTVTEATFAEVSSKMDDIIEQWRGRIIRALAEKVRAHLIDKAEVDGDTDPVLGEAQASSSSADVKGKGKAIEPILPDETQITQSLSLATTVFHCKACSSRFGLFFDSYDSSSEDDYFSFDHSFLPRPRVRPNPLYYPKVLGHRCLTKQRGFHWDHPGSDPTKQLDYPMGTRTNWTCVPLQIDEQLGKMVSNVVRACNLDPRTTTAVQMDSLDPKLACLECLRWSDEEWNQAEASVYGWRAAVSHNNRDHAGRPNIGWKLIDEELAQDVVNCDDQLLKPTLFSALLMSGLLPEEANINAHSEDAVWLCAQCLDLPQEKDCMDLSKVKNHLHLLHSIVEPQENRDYYKDFEAPQGRKTMYTPTLSISLTMDRPSNVPAPGEGSRNHWYEDTSDEDVFYDDYYGDEFYGDDYFF